MTDSTYTHGHHDSVLRSHRWRTVENSAAYLLDHLAPGLSVLDVGCGPGTITAGLARRVAPGPVVGLDPSPVVVAEADALVGAAGAANLSFGEGSVYDLPFADGSFDVVHAHQVLQHLGDPEEALAQMRRVCRPGGVVAVRDCDFPTMRYFPDEPELDRAIAVYGELTAKNGAQWDAGRKLLHWANRCGFASVTATASSWCYATEEERRWWGDLWAERFTRSDLADQLLATGLCDDDGLERAATAWRRWAASPDGWFAMLHGEILCTV